jgi:hypothetical protein
MPNQNANGMEKLAAIYQGRDSKINKGRANSKNQLHAQLEFVHFFA